MSKTKEKILETALSLFNRNGVAQVPLRAISDEMGISLGNLTYHFKKREAIIEALFSSLVSKISAAVPVIGEGAGMGLMEQLFVFTDTMASAFYEYRFIMLDFVQIVRAHEQIALQYQELLKQRKLQFDAMAAALASTGKMREDISAEVFDALFWSIRVLSDFGLSALLIDKKVLTEKELNVYAENMKLMLFPYLTDEGRTEFLELMAKK